MFGKVGLNNDKINPHGIGLGLTICNKILGQMGSELQVKSEYGQGTTFYFTIDVPMDVTSAELEMQFIKSKAEINERSDRSIIVADESQMPL
jgi:K+-sensing histidine kinase KdpD